MIQRRRQIQVVLQLLGDILATAGAILLAYWIRFDLPIHPVTKGTPPLEMYLQLIPMTTLMWPTVFYFQGLYQRRRLRSRFDELLRVVLAVMLATILLTAFLTFYRPSDFTYSRLFLPIFAGVDVLLVSFSRWLISIVLRWVRRSGGNLQMVLVVGAGELGKRLVESLQAHREYGFTVIGFLDDDPGKQKRKIHGVPVLGTTRDLEAIAAKQRIDQVMIALPMAAHHRIVKLIRRCGQLLVEIKVVPDLLQYYVVRAGTEELDGLPIINLTQIPLEGWNQIVKRVFDVIGAVALLIGVGWLFPIIAWLIKREDPGPAFYSQIRMGLDGRSFKLYKFRSMRIDNDTNGQGKWTRNDDPRVTRVGAFLRRYNLDELPQLLNVIKGDMSLVGPRPEQPEFVDRFKTRYPEYQARHRVRAGLTGWAQVNGLRGDTSIRQRVVHDLYYIENWSLALDLKILWRTLRLAVHDTRG
jgi:exopolysaccharide biosynthesis polyprenyl glycosylphosphotransferase